MHDRTEIHGFMAAKGGKVFAECWWDPYRPQLIHCNHSLGKSYTATAIGILFTQGRLRLEERVTDLFAEEIASYGIVPDEYMRQLTLYHVLTMTNGMARQPVMDKDWLKNYLSEPVTAQPGTEFLYNSSGSCLLGAVVKKKTGKGLKEFLNRELFEKIGIDGENFQILKFPDGYDAEPGTASRTEDNLRLALLYMNGGKWEGEKILSKEWVDQAMSCQIDTRKNGGTEDYLHGYGFQLWNSRIPGLYRFDGGQGQYGLIWPEKEIAVALHEGAMHPDGAQITLDVLYRYLLEEISDEPLAEDPAAYQHLLEFEQSRRLKEKEANVLAVPPQRFAGSYRVTAGDGDPWISVSPGGYNFFSCFYHVDKKAEFTDFQLSIDEKVCRFTADGYAMFEAYFDGTYRLVYTDQVIPEIGWNCSTARYLDENTLEITIKWMNGWFENRIRMQKTEEGLRLTFYKERLQDGPERYQVTHCEAVKICEKEAKEE
jgi:CubicO group peptidase (beta-lactamase class C family)